jgi:TonB family protein
MKKCPTCQSLLDDKFSFCPVDGAALPAIAQTPEAEFVAADTGAREMAAPQQPARYESVGADEQAVTGETTLVSAPRNGNGNGDGFNASYVADEQPAATTPAREEFHLTFVDDVGLTRRLVKQVREVGHDAGLTWPEFKRDPVGFTKRGASAYGRAGWRTVSQPYVAAGILGSFVAMIGLAVVLAVSGNLDNILCTFSALVGRPCRQLAQNNVREDLEFQGLVTEVPQEQPTPDPGTAGFNKGNGGGSKPKQEKPGGGGGGGRQEEKPASFGKLPPAALDIPQVRAPDPRPPTIKNPNLPVPAMVVADPLLVPPDPRNLPYGDPKSKSTETSSGPGTGNGIGSGTGGGVGPGEGGGVGPGRGGNIGGGDRNDGGGGPGGGGGGTDYSKIFTTREVSRKAQIISKPEPLYTEEARKNQITGTVTLRMVLNSNGSVTNIVAVSRLPDGLTEKAIAAARQIKFSPAEKDGRKVSQYATIQYNFNIY